MWITRGPSVNPPEVFFYWNYFALSYVNLYSQLYQLYNYGKTLHLLWNFQTTFSSRKATTFCAPDWSCKQSKNTCIAPFGTFFLNPNPWLRDDQCKTTDDTISTRIVKILLNPYNSQCYSKGTNLHKSSAKASNLLIYYSVEIGKPLGLISRHSWCWLISSFTVIPWFICRNTFYRPQVKVMFSEASVSWVWGGGGQTTQWGRPPPSPDAEPILEAEPLVLTSNGVTAAVGTHPAWMHCCYEIHYWPKFWLMLQCLNLYLKNVAFGFVSVNEPQVG